VALSVGAARVLRRLLQIPVALSLGSASILKAADPVEFAYQIERYGMLPASLTSAAAVFFIAVEFALAVALILDARPRLTLAGAGALFLLFTGVVAFAWSQGRIQQCGCFGLSVQRTPGETIVEDLLLLALVGASFILLRVGPPTGARTGVVAAAAAAGLLLPFVAPRLPVDDLVTALRPGQTIASLDPETLDEDLLRGERLIAIWGVSCPECVRDLSRLEALSGEAGMPRIVALFPDTNEEVMAFFLEHGPSFDLAAMPRAALKPYYRRLPVYFLLQDSRVVSVWRGSPPDAASIRRAIATADL
jgi:hypothetical protein